MMLMPLSGKKGRAGHYGWSSSSFVAPKPFPEQISPFHGAYRSTAALSAKWLTMGAGKFNFAFLLSVDQIAPLDFSREVLHSPTDAVISISL